METIIFNEFMEMDNLQLKLVNGGTTAEEWIVGISTVAGKLGSAVSTGIGIVVSAGVAHVANKTSSAIIGR